MSGTLFTDVMVFDGTGAAPFPGEVLVRGERIAAVAKGDERLPREGAAIVEGHGRTLMPGMVDGHGHLTWPTSVERVINTMKPLPIERHVLVTAQNARITLDHGFTSVYSAGSLGERIEPALRDMVDAGFLPGPRLRASALEKGAEGVLGVPTGHDPTHQRDIPHLREYVAQKAAEGCDTIKFLMSSDDAFQPGGSQTLMYSEEEAQAIGEAARAAGIWLACHAQGSEAVKRALRAGFRAIYHCTYADNEALDLFEEHKEHTFTAPAVGLLWARTHEAQDFGIGRDEAERMGAVRGIELGQQVIPEMKKRGIRVLIGGDYGFPYNPHGRNARDLEHFVNLFGFSPTEALVAATKHGGELMDLEVGVVREGWLADLLLVEGDPTRDVRIMQDKDNLAAIMKGGAFYKPPRAQHEAGRVTQPFLRDAWYMAAWSHEVAGEALLRRRLLGEPVLLMRKTDGALAALVDRCPHRFAPLSLGTREGDTIACAYHGLTFDAGGQCVRNPFSDTLPKGASVRSFPIVERDGIAWLWAGEPELADPAAIPDFSMLFVEGHGAPLSGLTVMNAPYQFGTDNLMDLSHIEFVHKGSFAGNGVIFAGEHQVREDTGSLHSDWWMPDVAAPPHTYGAYAPGTRCDHWLEMRWDAPASMYLAVGACAAGADRTDNPVVAHQAHILTPETAETTHYFWATTRALPPSPEGDAMVAGLMEQAFNTEDKPIIEAAYANLDGRDFWDAKPAFLGIDSGGTRARRRLETLIKQEQAA